MAVCQIVGLLIAPMGSGSCDYSFYTGFLLFSLMQKKSHKLSISPLRIGDTHHGSPSMTDMGMAPHTQQLDF